jgi:hypothetical protein
MSPPLVVTPFKLRFGNDPFLVEQKGEPHFTCAHFAAHVGLFVGHVVPLGLKRDG